VQSHRDEDDEESETFDQGLDKIVDQVCPGNGLPEGTVVKSFKTFIDMCIATPSAAVADSDYVKVLSTTADTAALAVVVKPFGVGSDGDKPLSDLLQERRLVNGRPPSVSWARGGGGGVL
jgi:hypothetical protein